MQHVAVMFASPPLAFLGMGDTEILVIMAVVLIFFGGEKMPELARGLGKMMREFRKATGEVEREFRRVIDEAENPAASLFKSDAAPPESRPFGPQGPALPPPQPSEDPREREGAATTPRAPMEQKAREEGDGEFHSDI
ncbi:MAG: Sec-independent protein translocase subunit TatA/TatB [Opitutaceae bacterium]